MVLVLVALINQTPIKLVAEDKEEENQSPSIDILRIEVPPKLD